MSSGAHERNTLQYDIIQGIQVPPEPDPVINNATLTGIDINENGVRDDVERALANFGNQSWRIYAIDAIKYARFGMDDASKMKGYYCNITKINPSISNRLQHLIYNTKERLDYYKLTPETSAIDCDKYINQELSKLEIINGLEVPNDPPTETNNLTLAGVDANNNGIRDDVERLIVQVYN